MSVRSRPIPRQDPERPDPKTEGGAPAAVADAAERLMEEASSPVVVSATRRVVAGFVLMIICLVILGILAAIIRRQQLNGFDAAISPILHGLASPVLDGAMQAATFIGSDPVLLGLLVASLAALAILRRPRREGLFLSVALAGSIALNLALKLVFARARPQFDWAHVPTDYSFPSGHSMNSFVFYLSAAVLIWVIAGRGAGMLAVAGALMVIVTVGVSRIYLGYHYFTDVIGGFTAGFLWLLIVAGIFEIAPRFRGPKRRGT